MNDDLTPEELQLVESLKQCNINRSKPVSPPSPPAETGCSSNPPENKPPIPPPSLEELMKSVDNQFNMLKKLADRLTIQRLPEVYHELEQIENVARSLRDSVEACLLKQKEHDARQAAASLLSQGFSFNRIEIDGMRFIITPDRDIQFVPR